MMLRRPKAADLAGHVGVGAGDAGNLRAEEQAAAARASRSGRACNVPRSAACRCRS